MIPGLEGIGPGIALYDCSPFCASTSMNFGVWTAIGIAFGAAVGAATDSTAAWMAIGVALGVAMGAATSRRADKSY